MNVERGPGGAYEILPGGVRGPLVWRNRGGRRTLTAHGRATLGAFQDMTLWVPDNDFSNQSVNRSVDGFSSQWMNG